MTEWFDDEDLPEDVRALVLTLVRVTSYGNAPELMDAGAAVAQLRAGLQGVRYVDGGWQGIVDGLARALAAAGGTLHAGTAVGAVDADGRSALVHAAYGPVETSAVILAGLPPAEAAPAPRPGRRTPSATSARRSRRPASSSASPARPSRRSCSVSIGRCTCPSTRPSPAWRPRATRWWR